MTCPNCGNEVTYTIKEKGYAAGGNSKSYDIYCNCGTHVGHVVTSGILTVNNGYYIEDPY